MSILAAALPVINVDDNFLIHNGWTESEKFTNPTWEPKTQILDPAPIKLGWNRRQYIIEPGETKQVPFDALRIGFGDPRSMMGQEQRFPGDDGRVGVIPRREAEVIRLSIWWGLYQQGMHLLPEFPIIKHATITTVPLGDDRPAVTVWVPANDPEGKHALYGHPEVEPNRADFLQIMEANERKTALVERKLEQVTQMLKQQGIDPDAAVIPDPNDGEIPKDLPTFP